MRSFPMSKFTLQERRNPEWYAMDLRQEMEIPDSEPIDLDNLLRILNIHLKIARIGKGILGACKVKGLHKLIVISPDILYETNKRFTISHEIGHLIIHHGVHYCYADDLKMWISKSTKEKEANKFAAELLLPQRTVKSKLKKHDVSLELAAILSNQYNISLTSAIIRLVELSEENVCVFRQKNDKICWYMRSNECRFSPRTGAISYDSLSYITSLKRQKQEGYVNPSSWFEEDEFDEDLNCHEETWYFENLNMKLSVVRLETDYW